jgi:tetratricopeptide (TPR) repeat protein
MAAGYLFALVPTLIIIVGAVVLSVKLWRQPRPELVLIMGVAVLSVVVLAYYTVKVPSYAAAKMFYVMPVLLSLCVFAAMGLEAVSARAGRWRWPIYVLLAAWGVNAYASFWIRRNAPATQILAARTLASEGQPAAAVDVVSALLAKDPRNPAALQLLAMASAQQNELARAESFARQALDCAPEDAEGHLLLGTILFQQRKLEPAIAEARRALELAPDHPKAASSLFAWLYQAGQRQQAAAACAESLRVNPFNADFHRGMAVVLRDLGDRTNALLHARLAEELKRGAVKH